MTDEQKERIVKLDMWPIMFDVEECTVRLKYDGESWNEEVAEHPMPYGISESKNDDYALPVYKEFLADKLLKAKCAIDLHRSGTRVTDNDHAQLSFNKVHLDALLTAAETEGVLTDE